MFSKEKKSFLAGIFLALFILIACSVNEGLAQTNALEQAALNKAEHMQNNLEVAKVGVEQSTEYGMYLTDSSGRTLYMFLADSRGESSSCYNRCAEVWPPLLTTGNPKAAASAVKSDMLGTITRRDGSMQVTYNGWPLYYYKKDRGQGELTGQDVKGFGAEWYLMAPSGSYIH